MVEWVSWEGVILEGMEEGIPGVGESGFPGGNKSRREGFWEFGRERVQGNLGSECEREENLGSLGLVKVRESGRE